jgi:hypothetical protein
MHDENLRSQIDHLADNIVEASRRPRPGRDVSSIKVEDAFSHGA